MALTAREIEKQTVAMVRNGLRFGVELEMLSIRRRRAAEVVASVLGGAGAPCPITGSDSHYFITDVAGRKWTIEYDGSLSEDGGAELVSPILTIADMDVLQQLVRALRTAGARCTSETGLHVHVDGTNADAPTVARLSRLVARHEDTIFKAFAVHSSRTHWAQPMAPDFRTFISNNGSPSRDGLSRAWYRAAVADQPSRCSTPSSDLSYERNQRRHGSRYRGLNIHSWIYRGSFEFRYFNGTMHAGEVRAAVLFCLHAVAYCHQVKFVMMRGFATAATRTEEQKMSALLDSFGIRKGDADYANVRGHLLKHIAANPATARRAAGSGGTGAE